MTKIMSTPEIITLHIGLSGHGFSTDEDAVDAVTDHLAARFPSFSIIEGTGFFRGSREKTLIVTIATLQPREAVLAAATIRESLGQDGVGIGYRGRYHRVTEGALPELE
jgi:hypothetical protein